MREAISRVLLGEPIDSTGSMGPADLPPDVTLRRGRLVPRIGGVLARMRGPAAAVAFRRTIVINPDVDLTPELLAHELVHVRQWRADPLFPVRYCLATLRHGYRDNPYEMEARAGALAAVNPQPGKDTT